MTVVLFEADSLPLNILSKFSNVIITTVTLSNDFLNKEFFSIHSTPLPVC